MTPPPSRPSASGLIALLAAGGLLLGATPALADDAELSSSQIAPAAAAPTDAALATDAQSARAATTSGDTLVGGEELAAGESIVSTSGSYTFVLQTDGNAVTYDPIGRPAWSSGTQGRGDHLAMQTDGNVVIYDAQDRPVWFTGTGDEPGATITVQDDGNLVVHRADGSPAWASSVGRLIPAPEITTLTAGQQLTAGRQLTDGATRAVMQTDGNFVVYGPGGPLWFTGTTGSGNRLVMQADGNAVIYGTGDSVKWSSGTGGHPGAVMSLEDGDLRIRSDSGLLWSSAGQVPHDTLQQGDIIVSGDQLTSTSGVWRAVMQRDGNVVVYGPRGADWSTGTSVPGSTLSLNRDGWLQVYSFDRGFQWTETPRTYFGIGQAGVVTPYRLVMQNDGNLVEYDGLGRAVWAGRGL